MNIIKQLGIFFLLFNSPSLYAESGKIYSCETKLHLELYNGEYKTLKNRKFFFHVEDNILFFPQKETFYQTVKMDISESNDEWFEAIGEKSKASYVYGNFSFSLVDFETIYVFQAECFNTKAESTQQ